MSKYRLELTEREWMAVQVLTQAMRKFIQNPAGYALKTVISAAYQLDAEEFTFKLQNDWEKIDD